MQTAWLASAILTGIVLAMIVGVVLGFWLKSSSTRAERSLLEQRNSDLSAELKESKEAVALGKADSESKASFEALAIERQGVISGLEAERNALREQLFVKTDAEPAQASRISQLEADLRNERQNLADQTALHEAVKQQFSAERREIIDRLEGERNALREELRIKAEAEPAQAARISQLEADLRNERQNLADQAALHGSTIQKLYAERTESIDRLESERNTLREELHAKTETEREQATRISRLEADLSNERTNLTEKLAILEKAKQTLSDQFSALANDILERKAKSFSEENKSALGTLLTPLRDQITDFRTKVEEAQKESLVGRTELSAELRQLKSLNEKLSMEAHSLSNALRQDTQKQGHWGEVILLNILENSGLRKDEHYTYQEAFLAEDEENGESRKRQTDVIVKLPGGRHLIVDCKVTLNAHNDYVDSVDDATRADALKRLLKSFRDHYNGLAERNYHRISELQSPDFVVLFAPIEPAFMLAIQKDASLWTDAYQRGILLAGPTTILFVVRIVENLWRQDQQERNVQKVMDRGVKLYDKFVGFVEDLEAVGTSIKDADQSYRDALSKLTSGRENLVRQVEMLRELGELKTKKKLKGKLLERSGVDVSPITIAAEAETEEG